MQYLSSIKPNQRFHNKADRDLPIVTRKYPFLRRMPGRVIHEVDVAYRFFLHQHPYTEALTQRLVTLGIDELQVADTEYNPDGSSLPYGIEADFDQDQATVIVPAGTRVGIPKDDLLLMVGEAQLELTVDTRFRVSRGAIGTVVDSLTPAPKEGTQFELADGKTLMLVQTTQVKLGQTTELRSADGSTIHVDQPVRILLPAGLEVRVGGDTKMLVRQRKMRPSEEFYADFFESIYRPVRPTVQRPYPAKDLDFSTGGGYSVYNWELFYHVPLTLAMHLSKNGRYAEAQRWLHYLFDPTDDSDEPSPQRYWKVKPFHTTDVKKIEETLVNLATGSDPDLRDQTLLSIKAWQDKPFRPHVIARYRPQAYMYKAVMAYLDNLIEWGDSLFRQDTGEAVDEAMMIYVLAANILGPRPQAIPSKGSVRPQTYANLRRDLSQFGNAVQDMELDLAFDIMPVPQPKASTTEDERRQATIQGLGRALYFCVPCNDKLLGYWDTVADRLFKIRNSLNLKGAFRQLALFEPPIDPALLARAAASGVDVASAVGGLNQPLPLVRFQLLAQKASELAQEVKSLGAGLLSAIEKEDNEALAALRARHERATMEAAEHVRYGQLQEAIKSREGLLVSLDNAVRRFGYFEQQLGKKTDEVQQAVPKMDPLDIAALQKMKLSMKEPEVVSRDIAIDIAQNLGESAGKLMNSYEASEMRKLAEARDLQDVMRIVQLAGQVSALIPQFDINLHFWGLGLTTSYGGENLAKLAQFIGEVLSAEADKKTYEAGTAAKIGAYSRREQDWAHQSNTAVGEINQTIKQLRVAQIREAIAERELENHRKQIAQSEEVERFLNEEGSERDGKRANRAFYTWMKREAKGLHTRCFQLAFDTARKAERALQHELGHTSLTYIGQGQLAGKEGMFAGEKLLQDIKRMELAYLDLNARELELTKDVSLLQVDPLALVRLRETGRCTVRLEEPIFDLEGAGHYFRRLKHVELSIPSVTGAYTSVNCTLSLLKSSIRNEPSLGDGYARVDSEDPRFDDYFGRLQSVVISKAQKASGMFEANLRDERYLPFEYSGVISEWELRLPADPSKGEPTTFDYATISDAVLHLYYTARDGGQALQSAAKQHVNALIDEAKAAGCVRFFSLRQEFPMAWAAFRSGQATGQGRYAFEVDLREEHFPYWGQNRLKKIKGIELLARPSVPAVNEVDVLIEDSPLVKLTQEAGPGKLLQGGLADTDDALPESPVGKLSLYLDSQDIDDIWLAMTWGGA